MKEVVEDLDTENTDKIEGAVTEVTVDAIIEVTRSDSLHIPLSEKSDNETFSEKSKIVFHRSSTEVPVVLEVLQKSKIVVNSNEPFSEKSANETFSEKSKIVFHRSSRSSTEIKDCVPQQ